MVVVHQRPTALVMSGPSARIVTIKRESLLARPAPAPQRSRWQCSICGKLLSSKRSYDEHLNIHNQARPFTCDHCEYAAASQMTLRRHILRNHTSRDDWHYKCPYCGETYMEPASYQQHVSSRHFGRSATFGCPFTACTFLTKCSKHFREHLVKHHSCPSLRRNGREGEEDTGSSSRSLPTNPSSLTDENLQHYLVDDDLGVGFGRRATSMSRPIIRSNGEIESVIAAAAERAANVASGSDELNSKIVAHHHGSSSISNSVSTLVPQRRMLVLRKSEKNDDQLLSLPSTSSTSSISSSSSMTSSTISSTIPSSREDLNHIPIIDDDFMKAPIALRPSIPTPSLNSRLTPRRVQLAPIGRRIPQSHSTSIMIQRRGMKVEEGMDNRVHPSSPSPSSSITLGGSRHAPAMISADADVWMIEHEEEVNETNRNVHVYDNGSIDFECD